MANRWEITKAVRRSNLPAVARLVMLVLADAADVGTAEIPPQHTPSLSVLADETGLARSTVAEHLKQLELAGWVVRTPPNDRQALGRKERTRYRLSIPVDGLVRETDQSASPVDGPGLVRETDTTSPGAGHIDRSSYQDQTEEPSSSAEAADTPREDVQRLCAHLADRIEANGSPRPTIGQKWRDAARLMLDRDGRAEEQIHRAIEWCQDHEFWRANVRSMPKLREQYDQLRLQAQRQRGSPNGYRSQTDANIAALLNVDQPALRALPGGGM